MKKLTAIIASTSILTSASALKANTSYHDYLNQSTAKQVSDNQEQKKIMLEGPIYLPDLTKDNNLDFTIKCKKYGLVYVTATSEGRDESALDLIRTVIEKMHKGTLKYENHKVKKVRVWGYYQDNPHKTLELTDFAVIDKDGNDRHFLMI